MEIGCGARVRDFDGRRYFYFWHYERTNGRSVRKEDYIGRVDSDSARSDLLRRMAVKEGRLGLGPVGPSTSDGGLPPEGRTGVRAAPGPDRDPDRLDSYPHLEVRFHVGDGEGGSFRVGVGNVYPPLVGSSVRATRGTALRRIRPGRPPRRMPAVHRWVEDGPLRHGDLLLPLLLLSRLGREDVQGRRLRG